MFNRTKLASAVSGLAIAIAVPVTAQNQSGSSETLEEVYVTGSRIQRSTFDTPAPVTVLDAGKIQAVGATNVGEFLAKIPSTISEINSSNEVFSNTASGLQITALRNLEAERTLVLVNGRRFVSGLSPGAGYAVDLNAIPTSIIERVEILTGGTSAVYGSDAVAGVVNIITKKDFEGIELNVQGTTPEQGERNRQDFDITVGGNFDRGNTWLSLGYSKDEGMSSRDRSFSDTDIAYYDQVAIDELGLPGGPRWDWLGSSFPPAGRFGSYLGDGSDFRSGLGDRANSDRFNRADFRDLASPVERRFAAGGARFELSEQAAINLEVNYSQVEVSTAFEPFPLDLNDNVWDIDRGGTGGHDVASSLLMPQRLKDNLLADGITNLNELPLNLTSRRLVEFGARGSDIDRRTFRVAGDFDVNFDNDWNLNTFVTWGETDTDQQTNSGINRERAALALEVERGPDGQLRCINEAARLQGCAPFNPFGAGTISQEAVDYLGIAQSLESTIEQLVVGSTLSGELPLELPGGNIGFAFGLEYREEKGAEFPDAAQQAGITTSNKILATDGEFDVTEGYLEVRVPLFEQLILEGAWRSGDYSTIGSADTWKVGLDIPVVPSVRFRATVSESVRAPNIADLFAGAGETFATFTDSCDGITAASTGTIAENCRSVPAIAQRIADTGAFTLTQVEIQSTGGFEGGNPDVQEETAESFTIGVVLTPSFIENFSLALDWYDIEIDDAITIVDRGTVVRRCYEAAGAAFDPACGGQTIRDPASGALTQVNSGSSNEEILTTSGLDIELRYFVSLNNWSSALNGDLSFSLLYNYLDKYEIEGIQDGIVDDETGEIEFPDNRFTLDMTYTLSELSVNWRIDFIDEVVDSNTPEIGDENGGVFDVIDKNGNTCSSTTYHAVQGSYNLTESINAYFGVNNLFDEDPCILGQITQYGSTGINTDPSIYDINGREYYAGVRMRF